jgi:syntaxin 8
MAKLRSTAKELTSTIPSLQKQLNDLTAQFHGFATPSTTTTLTHPNDPLLQPDFTHATSASSQSLSQSQNLSSSIKKPTASPRTSGKTVRFRDSGSANPSNPSEDDIEAQLFGPYRDDPSNDASGYRDEAQQMSNQQIHAYHSDILAQQDEQLDRLGESIGRQRELSMQIGDELDSHVAMLDEVDVVVDRHQSRLDRGRKMLGKIARGAGENKQMTAIVILIIVLVLLIAVLK